MVNTNSIVQHVIQNKNGVTKHVNVNVKVIITVKIIILGILADVFEKYLKSVADTSVTECHKVKIPILKLLSLKLMIRSEFLRVFLVKITMKIGQEKIYCWFCFEN